MKIQKMMYLFHYIILISTKKTLQRQLVGFLGRPLTFILLLLSIICNAPAANSCASIKPDRFCQLYDISCWLGDWPFRNLLKLCSLFVQIAQYDHGVNACDVVQALYLEIKLPYGLLSRYVSLLLPRQSIIFPSGYLQSTSFSTGGNYSFVSYFPQESEWLYAVLY